MTHKPLKERLTEYLKKNHGYIAKGALEDIVKQHTHHTADYASRQLRNLCCV